MKLGPSLMSALVVALTAAPAVAQQPVTVASLQGAWKLVSLSYDGKPQKASGYIVFSGNHYTFVTNRERPMLPDGVGTKTPEQLTAEENRAYVEAFRNMTAAGGPFTIKGEQILLVREVARTPNLTGGTETRKSWFDNGRLVQDFMGGDLRQVYIWERAAK